MALVSPQDLCLPLTASPLPLLPSHRIPTAAASLSPHPHCRCRSPLPLPHPHCRCFRNHFCSFSADDPAPFEAELKQRERALGMNHPDVAESCSNLAILYNQKGDTGGGCVEGEHGRRAEVWMAKKGGTE